MKRWIGKRLKRSMIGRYARLLQFRLTVEVVVNVSEVFRMLKDAVTPVAAKVIGYRDLSHHRKENA